MTCEPCAPLTQVQRPRSAANRRHRTRGAERRRTSVADLRQIGAYAGDLVNSLFTGIPGGGVSLPVDPVEKAGLDGCEAGVVTLLSVGASADQDGCDCGSSGEVAVCFAG